MYAIIEDSGTQIKVKQGDTIKVALRELDAEQATVTFEKASSILLSLATSSLNSLPDRFATIVSPGR
jgi:ribosomal protein L21